MRVLILKADTDLAALRTKLIRADAGAEAMKRAAALFAAGNPHVKQGTLRAGTAVFVPDAPEFDTKDTDNVIGPVLEELTRRAAGALGDLKRRMDVGERHAASERELLVKALKSRTVKAAADSNEQLRKDIGRLAETLAQEAKQATERSKLTEQALKQADADLAELRQRFA